MPLNEKPPRAPEGNNPERRLGYILNTKLKLSALSNRYIAEYNGELYESGGNIPTYTPTNQVHPMSPDQIVGRKKGQPNCCVILLHGVKWHSGRERKDFEKRARYEAAKCHVLEIAYGQMNKGEEERFWAELENVLYRTCVEGENIRYFGRIEDLIALSMPELEAEVFK